MSEENKQPVYARYLKSVMVEVLDKDNIASTIRFDNGEKAVVMNDTLEFTFDLNEGNEDNE